MTVGVRVSDEHGERREGNALSAIIHAMRPVHPCH